MVDYRAVPVPKSVRDVLAARCEPLPQWVHPGLWLDRYPPTHRQSAGRTSFQEDVQRPFLDDVAQLSQQPPDRSGRSGEPTVFDEAWQRRKQLLAGATTLAATTVGPLTLHLSRASALENAGLCVHPIYGFAYLPGSGLKGLARAFAETVWLAAETEAGRQDAAWRMIEDVFGWAPNRLREQQINDPQHPAQKRMREPTPPLGEPTEIGEHAGSIVFHDAWPVAWPKLEADLLNSHHTEYYDSRRKDDAADEKQQVPPPGDWESPNMVSFLTVAAGTTFQFAVAPRRTPLPDELREADERLRHARQWLSGGLEMLGAGAKTASGYGAFRTAAADPLPSPARRRARTFRLRLETPAFLGGAHSPHDAEAYAQHGARECDLRPATLRGHLRWWWRTLHAAWMRPAELRHLESLLWGDTQQAGAIRLIVEPDPSNPPPLLFQREEIVHRNGLPKPPNNKTTQGLAYCSYGMSDSHRFRYYRPPGCQWTVTIQTRTAQRVKQDERDERETLWQVKIPAEIALQQAQAALWLLCRFGGVGSKSRKGFGALATEDLPDLSLSTVQQQADDYRQRWASQTPFRFARNEKPDSPALEVALPILEVPTPWTNDWLVLDRLGDALQRLGQAYKHNEEKKALGVPRHVRPPLKARITLGPRVQETGRHASPLHLHVGRQPDGRYVIRGVAFPSSQLPNFEASRQFLTTALAQIRQELEREVADANNQKVGTTPAWRPPAVVPAAAGAAPKVAHPKSGERVAARLLQERSKSGGWRAEHPPTGLQGPIQNSQEVPLDAQPGQELELIVAIGSPTQIAFRYPTPADLARLAKGKKKS